MEVVGEVLQKINRSHCSDTESWPRTATTSPDTVMGAAPAASNSVVLTG